MAYDKVVDSNKLNTDIKKICDAIRIKGGISNQLSFPQGMINAINNISINNGDKNGNNNCEAYVLVMPNLKISFKTTTGIIKVWGYGKGVKSGYQQPNYAFEGDKYKKIASYGEGSETNLTLSIDSQGNLTGLPQMTEGVILVTKGI